MGAPTFLDDPTTHTFFPSVSNPHNYGQATRVRKGREGERKKGRKGGIEGGQSEEEREGWMEEEAGMDNNLQGNAGHTLHQHCHMCESHDHHTSE